MRFAVIFVSLAIAVAARAGETVDLIVEFRRPAIEELRRDLARLESHRGIATNADEHPATITHTFSRVLQGAGIRVHHDLRGAIEDLPYVASVHVARTFEPLLHRSVPHIHADRVWDRDRTRGAGVTVAVIDSGIDYRHAAFGGSFGPGAKVTGGWDFVNDDGDPMDDHGHGTHVAGIIGAAGEGLVGVAPTASLLAYKVLDANGRGAEADIIAAIERTVDPNQDGDLSDHADIANISLGASAVENDPLVHALENATAAGVLFIVAAGNDGQRRPGGNYGDILAPAIAPSALSVGAAGIDDRVAQFSSRGPSYTYAIKPEIVAPGVDIVSAKRNGGAVGGSGTSMAAPHVAGVAALIKSLHRDWTPEEVKAAIVGTARSLAEDVMMAGAGRVDALDAASATTLAMPPVVNFGQIDASDVVWHSSESFLLRNVSTTTQTLTSSVSGLREGVVVRTVPSSLTLEPGQAKRVNVEIEVANRSVPAASAGSRSYEGQIVWSGGAVPIRLPWAFVKAAFLTIGERDGNEVQAVVIGDGEKFTTRVFLGRNRVFWSLENVDVVVTKSGTTDRVAVVEQVAIEGSPLAAVAIADAALTVTAVTTDENGGPLRGPGRDCAERLVLSFPQGKRVPARNETRFTPLSSRIRIYVLNHCADVARGTIHAAIHDPIQGLERDVISAMQPRWLRQEVRFVPDVAGQTTTVLPRMRFPGPESQFFIDEGSPWRGLPSNMTILFTPSPGHEVDLMMEMAREDIDRVRLYLSERSVKSDSDLFLEISPMAYEVPAGTPMTFGPPAVFPEVQFFSVDPLFAQAVWFGPFGERRPRDNPKLIVSQLSPGAWRLESRNGSATYIGVVDTTKGDPFLPLFTALRIANGSLLFSIIDVAPGFRVEPREAMTRVDYRAHGASEWRPLFPQVVARQYLYNSLLPPGIGTMFRVDLSHLRGSIDLRVHAEDEAGNTIELRIEPAFTASSPTRRRAVGR